MVRRIQNKWYVDFRFRHPNGSIERVRRHSPIPSKAAADEYERPLRNSMIAPTKPKEVPKFSIFVTQFMSTYVIANNKPSERAAKECIAKHHLLAPSGAMLLDDTGTIPIDP